MQFVKGKVRIVADFSRERCKNDSFDILLVL